MGVKRVKGGGERGVGGGRGVGLEGMEVAEKESVFEKSYTKDGAEGG
jgi:hypothetical protein